ncbi:MAG: acyl-CoA carboxylase subunit epsilon [Actinomycetota bacterium]|nr:acyl-CoA carboxylase subunit epsilon [Actinomycetota bacterium]
MTGSSEQAPEATGPEAPAVVIPAIRVVSGWPADDELAALIAVLSAAAASGGTESAERPGSRWSAPSTRLRSAYGPRRGGWRASGLPS